MTYNLLWHNDLQLDFLMDSSVYYICKVRGREVNENTLQKEKEVSNEKGFLSVDRWQVVHSF